MNPGQAENQIGAARAGPPTEQQITPNPQGSGQGGGQLISFICFRCQKVYKDLKDLWECLLQHGVIKP